MAIKITPLHVPGRPKPWKVDLSAKVSESGTRERHFFKTKRAAEGFIDQQEVRLTNVGTDSALLTPAQREAALKSFSLLGDVNPMALVEVVNEWLERRAASEASVTMAELWDTFAAEKKGKSPHYHRQIRSTRNRFSGIDEKMVSEIRQADIEEALAGFPPTAFNGYLRVIRAVLNFAVKRDWAKENASKKIDFSETANREVEILTNNQVARLLVACRKYFPQDIPYTCIGLFAGVRPEELIRMEWGMIRLEENHILLPADVTKTGRRRVIDIEPALKSWLAWHIEKGGNAKGPIVESTNLRSRLRALREQAKITDWPQDGMRLTYASNFMAMHENVDRLLLNMGHTSTQMLWEHYHQAVLKKHAQRFWQLCPKSEVAPASKPRRITKMPPRKVTRIPERKPKLIPPARKAVE